MKSVITIACSLFLLGCSNENPSATTSAQPSPTVVEENMTTEAPTVETSVETAVSPTEVPLAISATIPPAAQTPKPVATIDGGTLYGQKCASCHGAKAEKSALNKSQVIAGWKAIQVKNALNGYQAGTYGKEMKALMQGQTKALNDAQIDALAQYIATL
jgi:cytochrome c